jgi:hypothetical protein
MGLLVVYVAIVAVGDLVAVGIGEVLDRVAPVVSLPVFLALWLGVFFFGWRLAVHWTEPRTTRVVR